MGLDIVDQGYKYIHIWNSCCYADWPLTPAPGGGAVESHSWTAKYYLIHSRDGDLTALDWQR